MKMSLSEQITYSTVLIKCKYANGTGRGTGFIFHFFSSDKICVPAIVTNYHVVEKSIETEFEFCLSNVDGSPNDKETVIVKDSSSWIRHPNNIDLCILPISKTLMKLQLAGKKVYYIPLASNLIPNESTIEKFHGMEEITMVGYPIGLSDSYNHKPIIRRGITATHLKNDYLGKKEFLIDMACFPGSSGSPIFVMNEGLYTNGHSVSLGDRVFFVGILWGGPQYDVTGEIVQYTMPNFCSQTQIPINLGYVIKSSQLFDFESLIDKALKILK